MGAVYRDMLIQHVLRVTLTTDETLKFNRKVSDRNEIVLEVEHAARDANCPAHIYSSGGRLLLALANPWQTDPNPSTL